MSHERAPPTSRLLMKLVRAIAAGQGAAVKRALVRSPALAKASLEVGATRLQAEDYFLEEILHHVVGGNTLLHVAAAAHNVELVRKLITMGANVRARNRSGAEPIHYAVAGGPGAPHWKPPAQVATIERLIAAGADIEVATKNGTKPLHGAVRNRCSAAVRALLDAGADPKAKSKSASTPIKLAKLTTGRGGSGSPQAKAEQAEILRLLKEHGA
jgi:ankyrin repeat protein